MEVSSYKISDRKYHRVPIVEALCEIWFTDSSWDATVPGAFFERVKGDFPKKRQRTIEEALSILEPEQSIAATSRLPPWMHFTSDEKHQVIQLAENLLVVSQLAPCPRFEQWEADVYRALSIYKELAHPKSVSRLGLRYINRVVIPRTHVRMEEYFTIYPNLPQRLGGAHGNFLIRVEIPQSDRGHVVIITFGNAPSPNPPESGQAFMLDLYDSLVTSDAAEESVIRKEIRRAHENIVLAFEDSITDKLRELLEDVATREDNL